MGKLAIEAVAGAVHALVNHDKVKADEIIKADKGINDLERQIDESIVQIVARRQPTATDLRYVMSISKAVVDIERIGDEAVKIAHVARTGVLMAGIDIASFAERVGMMSADALEAFADENLHNAFDVMQMDALLIDKEYADLIQLVGESSNVDTPQIMQTLLVIRSLERIGDHARNLAEFIIYTKSGTDVRHTDLNAIKAMIDG